MLRVFVIVLVFIGAIVVFILQQPEQVFVRSQDQVVELQGLSRSVRSITIESFKEFSPILNERISLYYFIVPNPAGIPFDVNVSAKVLEQWKQLQPDLTELSLYRWTSSNQQWKAIPTVVDLSNETLSASMELQEPTWIAVGMQK